jgi:hypothetical protein
VGEEFKLPCLTKCSELQAVGLKDQPISVVCVKYGTKYGADYVNKLFWGVHENLKLEHTFSCFTDDPTGLDSRIIIKPLKHNWQGWWSKVHIFDPSAYQ